MSGLTKTEKAIRREESRERDRLMRHDAMRGMYQRDRIRSNLRGFAKSAGKRLNSAPR